MEIQAIMTLIMAIITMIMQFFAGGPVPPPPPSLVTTDFATVSCAASRWVNNQSSDMYVAGTVIKECDFELNQLPLSSVPVIGRLNGFVQDQLALSGTRLVQTVSEDGALRKSVYETAVNVNSAGERVVVGGSIELQSDLEQTLNTLFTARSLPQEGNGSFLKYLRTQTRLHKVSGTVYHVQFSNYSTVLRPWFAPASQFGTTLIKQQKEKMDVDAVQTIQSLLSSLN